jgi:signal recognition particle subunit SRP54
MQELKKMGPLGKIVQMMPGLPGIGKIKEEDLDEAELAHVEAIIRSMTPQERRNPKVIDGKRKKRIARGSGMRTTDVNDVLNQFEMVKKMVKSMTVKSGKRKAKMSLAGLRGLQLPN